MKIFKRARVLIIVVCAFAGVVVGTDLSSALRLTNPSAFIPIAKAAGASAPGALPGATPSLAPQACPPAGISGTIGSGSPNYPFVTGSQTSRLFRNSTASDCVAAKPFPGLTDAGTQFGFDAYTFTNTSASSVCITVTTTAGAPNQVFTVAYLDSFNPANLQANYLGDAGNSETVRSFSFTVQGNRSFVVVQHRVNNAPSPPSLGYSFGLHGLPGCDQCPPSIISGTIGSGSPEYPFVTGSQTSRLFRNAVESSCGPPKPVPNLTDDGTQFVFDAYTFSNTSASSVCITVTTTAGANNQLFTVAYLDSFNPADVQDSYVGDGGNSDKVRSFSFNVPGNRSFVVVQSRVNNASNPPSLDYSFRVLGLPGCDQCAPSAISGAIGSGSEDYPSATGNQTGRLFRNNVATNCGSAKPVPSVEDATELFQFDAYTFLNTSASPVCITINTTAGAPNQIFTAAYLDRFNRFDVQENYLGDAGNSNTSRSFSFTVPGKRSFVVVQHRVNNAANPASLAYTFGVVGVPGCEPPVCSGITCPFNIVSNNAPGQCGATVNYPLPSADPSCGAVGCLPPPGFFPVGTTTVTCSIVSGASCSFNVTVKDTQPPSVACPANIVVKTATNADRCAVATYTVPASDNCPNVTVGCSPPSGTCFPLGATTVTCTATDASGNSATCSFTVTVFNVCLEDDINPGAVFLGNTLTGAYRFCCGTTLFTGIAQVTTAGNVTTFQHNSFTRRVQATFDVARSTGSASLESPPGTTRCTIIDRDTRNNDCLCR
jgi:hypothetical protein